MIEVAAEPVVIAIVLSVASPVVTVSAPVSELAVILPTRPVTVSAAEPDQRQRRVLASAVALTVTTSLAPLAVIEVAAEPVVIDDAVVDRIARRHGQRPGQGAGRDIADQAGHCLCRRARKRQRRILRQRGRGHRHGIGAEVVGDRGRRRAGGDRNRIVGCIPRGHGERAGERTGRDIADQPADHLGRRADKRQHRIVGKRRGIDRHRIACTIRGDRGCGRAGGDRRCRCRPHRPWSRSAPRSGNRP